MSSSGTTAVEAFRPVMSGPPFTLTVAEDCGATTRARTRIIQGEGASKAGARVALGRSAAKAGSATEPSSRARAAREEVFMIDSHVAIFVGRAPSGFIGALPGR